MRLSHAQNRYPNGLTKCMQPPMHRWTTPTNRLQEAVFDPLSFEPRVLHANINYYHGWL